MLELKIKTPKKNRTESELIKELEYNSFDSMDSKWEKSLKILLLAKELEAITEATEEEETNYYAEDLILMHLPLPIWYLVQTTPTERKICKKILEEKLKKEVEKNGKQ